MRKALHLIALLTVLSLLGGPASADGSTASTALTLDKDSFLAQTAATSATGALPHLAPAQVVTIESLTFTSRSGGDLLFGAVGHVDWTPYLEGHDLAIALTENFDVALATPTTAFGFDMVEPNYSFKTDYDVGCNTTCADSTFTVTLKSGGDTIGSQQFYLPDNQTSFVGLTSDTPFDLLEIRETIGGGDNEYFGQFYIAGVAQPLPDSDADGVSDVEDNCVSTANGDQADADGDGVGDACDPEHKVDTSESPGPVGEDQCKKDGWMTFQDPTFKNQGLCVSYVKTDAQPHF